MEITLVPVDQRYIETLLGLMRAYYSFERLAFDENLARQAVLLLLNNGQVGSIWLIESGEVTVGYLAITFGFSLEFGGRDAFIDEFFIHEGYRNLGIGKTVLTLVEPYLRERDIRAIHLEVDRTNDAARTFYTRQGFISRDRFYLMSKPLTKD